MKKILVLFVLLLLTTPSFAADYTQYCSAGKANPTLLGNLGSLTGINFISRNIMEGQISNAIKKEVNSKFNVDLDSFFGVNVLNGEFKGLKASTDNFNFDGLAASKVAVETLCPYNRVGFNGEKLVLKENMVLKYDTEINQSDLNKIASSAKYLKIIEKINKDSKISSLVKVTGSNLQLDNNKLILNYSITPVLGQGILSRLASATTFNLSFSTGLKAEKGELKLCNFALNSKKIGLDALLPLVNKFNPLTYGLKLGETNKGTIQIDNVTIANSKIKIDGTVLLPKEE